MISHVTLSAIDLDYTVCSVFSTFRSGFKAQLAVNEGIVLITEKRKLVNSVKPLLLLLSGEAELGNKRFSVNTVSIFINKQRLYIIACADILGVLFSGLL